MTTPDPAPHDEFGPHPPAGAGGRRWRWALVALPAAAAVAVLLGLAVHVSERESERRADLRRQKTLEAIRAGQGDQAMVHDGKLVRMIAADSECAVRATSLVFVDVDFSEAGFEQLSRLENLQDVGAYSCSSADQLLFHLQQMPSIRKLWFEMSPISDRGAALLGTLPGLTDVHFEQVMSEQQIKLLRSTLVGVRLEFPHREPAAGP